MSKLLFVTSSLFGEQSKSRLVAEELLSAWTAGEKVEVVRRDLAAEPLPHVDAELLTALGKSPGDRSPQEAAAVARADAVIEDVEAADTIILAVPMYNFSVPSTFKAWIDHLARAGRTFRYTASGPEGLLKGKKVLVASARGGVYSHGAASASDFQEPYIRAVLGFVGIEDVTFIHAEGLAISPESAEAGLAQARSRIAELAGQRLAA